MKNLTTVIAVLGFWLLPASAEDRQVKLEESLGYLRSIPEASWVHFERNSVFVGLLTLTPDLRLVASAAAMAGSRAMDFGCHVYFFEATTAPAKTTDGSLAFCSASARHGKLTSNTCQGSVVP